MEMDAAGTWSEKANQPGYARIRGYFDREATDSLIPTLSRLLEKIHGIGETRIAGSEVPNSDWRAEWKKGWKPQRLGKAMVVLPSWWDDSGEEGTVIRIHPGMAFGTGTHPSTRLCLLLLERLITGNAWTFPPSLMDLGCGSGILAIAGMKLGAGKAVAVDNDPIALENARENARLNQVVLTCLSGIPDREKFDLIISNIIAETHLQLMERTQSCLKKDGLLALSGIIDNRVRGTLEACAASGLSLKEQTREGEWTCLLFKAKA